MKYKWEEYPVYQIFCIDSLISISKCDKCEIGWEKVAEKPYKDAINFDEKRGDEKEEYDEEEYCDLTRFYF